jgi:hypothetical protein
MRFLWLGLLVLACGCLCYSTEPEVHTVTFYGNEFTSTSLIASKTTTTTTTVPVHTTLTSTTVLDVVSHDTSPTTIITLPDVHLSTATGAQSIDLVNQQLVDMLSSTTEYTAGVGCVDSDGGSNTDVKGVVGYGDFVYVDYCDGDRLYEYLCDDGAIKSFDTLCLRGCSGGRCGGDMSTTTKA